MRRAAKVDDNQAEIVAALRAVGASVFILKLPCDLLVGYRGQNYLLEVKDGRKPPSARRLTELQRDFQKTWRGKLFTVVETKAQAKAAIGAVQ